MAKGRKNNQVVKFNASVYRRFNLFRLKREGILKVGDLKPESCSNGVLNKYHLELFKETSKISCRRYFETGVLVDLEIEKIKKEDYVYVFVNKEYAVCKIGYSNNPIKRLAQIQTGCPFKITRQLMIPGGVEKERELHDKYKGFRLEGEWFAFKGELKDAVLSKTL